MNEPSTSVEMLVVGSAPGVGAPAGVGLWKWHGKHLCIFVLLVLGYALSFSFDSGDALDAARWMQNGEIERLVEFRHLVQRLWPFWLWQSMAFLGLSVEPLSVLRGWDLVTAAASVMLLYSLLHQITTCRWAPFWGCLFYATTHCVWGYAGSGRLYSTSMLFVFGSYYLALQVGRLHGPRKLLVAAAAGILVCFAALFWLVQIFNIAGVGLLVLLGPVQLGLRHRLELAGTFAVAGLLSALAVGASCLHYAGVPFTLADIQMWISEVKTPPTQLDWLSPAKAAFGQVHGVIAVPGLNVMINGVLRGDPDLLKVGTLHWQLFKFVAACLGLALAYIYPWVLLSKRRANPGLILALYSPLAINLYFALNWLGTDRQRFMPAMFSIVALSLLSTVDIVRRVAWPGIVAGTVVIAIIFMASVNFMEVLIPSQQKFLVLEGAWEPLKPILSSRDRVIDFGRDMDYQPLITFYADASHLSLTNDATVYNWDHTDWKDQFREVVSSTESRGGRVFVVDRLVLAEKPIEAAWSLKQHPSPTPREFAEFLAESYCIRAGFLAGSIRYLELATSYANCPGTEITGALAR